MVTLPIFPANQYVCHSHAAATLMTFTQGCLKDTIERVYNRAKERQSQGLYYELVNTLLYHAMNLWVDMQEARDIDATLIREMSVHDQEEYVRVYENRYNLWLKGKDIW